MHGRHAKQTRSHSKVRAGKRTEKSHLINRKFAKADVHAQRLMLALELLGCVTVSDRSRLMREERGGGALEGDFFLAGQSVEYVVLHMCDTKS